MVITRVLVCELTPYGCTSSVARSRTNTEIWKRKTASACLWKARCYLYYREHLASDRNRLPFSCLHKQNTLCASLWFRALRHWAVMVKITGQHTNKLTEPRKENDVSVQSVFLRSPWALSRFNSQTQNSTRTDKFHLQWNLSWAYTVIQMSLKTITDLAIATYMRLVMTGHTVGPWRLNSQPTKWWSLLTSGLP